MKERLAERQITAKRQEPIANKFMSFALHFLDEARGIGQSPGGK